VDPCVLFGHCPFMKSVSGMDLGLLFPGSPVSDWRGLGHLLSGREEDH
jgi:hypothetical protein